MLNNHKPYLVDGNPVSFRELIRLAQSEGYDEHHSLVVYQFEK